MNANVTWYRHPLHATARNGRTRIAIPCCGSPDARHPARALCTISLRTNFAAFGNMLILGVIMNFHHGLCSGKLYTIDLGDKRRDKRAVLLAERLAEKPMASIPGACGGWAETQAADRFLTQENEGRQDILEPRWRCSAVRMGAHRTVLCIQETTELDFNGQTITDFGPLSFEAQRGMYLHPTYAVSAGESRPASWMFGPGRGSRRMPLGRGLAQRKASAGSKATN